MSAEPQTPITKTAMTRARQFGAGKLRVNLGPDSRTGTLYFGELLREFLRQGGVDVLGDVQIVAIPASARQIYVYRSTQTLAGVVSNLLEYSTNFMANQIFLVLGAKVYGAPATVEKGRQVLTQFLQSEVGWQGFSLAEGAGLSRQNSVTPRQMMALLNYFQPNIDLLPEHFGAIRAKTGTLNGVNTLAGYFNDNKGGLVKFVILVNSPVPYDYKFRLAKQLYLGVTGHAVPKAR